MRLAPGGDGDLEDVAAALEVDPPGLLAAAEDREGEMDDDVGAVEERRQRAAVEHVAAPVADLPPAHLRRVEGPSGHPAHRAHRRVALELVGQRQPDLTSRPGDGDGQSQSHGSIFIPAA